MIGGQAEKVLGWGDVLAVPTWHGHGAEERPVNAGIGTLDETTGIIGNATGEKEADLIHRHIVVVTEMRRCPTSAVPRRYV